MIARTAGLVASLALAANAILLPPGVSLDTAASKDPASTLDIDASHQVIRVPCPGCAFAESGNDDRVVWTDGIENELVFELDTGARRDSLKVNGAQLFPPSLNLIPEPIYIHQVPSGVDLNTFSQEHPRRLGLRVTGYEFRFDSAETISEDGNELLPMSLTINSIAGVPIPTQNLRIFTIKDVQGHLNIASVTASIAPALGQEECTDSPMLCRLKAFLAGKMDSLRRPHRKPGCHGGAAQSSEGMPHREGKPPHTMQPHHHNHDGHRHHGHRHHGHRHHGHHSKMHAFLHAFKRVIFTVLIPILVGIVAGLVTYLVGMVIGTAIGLVWMKLSGRGGQYQRIALDEEDVRAADDDLDGKDEKEVYIVDSIAEAELEAPPAYRDVDGEEKEVVS